MTLRNGKFYDADGQMVPLEFGNKEQIQLLNLASALNGDGVCLDMLGTVEACQFNFRCLCGHVHIPVINSKFTCKCGLKYKCFDTYYLPAVKFAKPT